MTRAVAAGAAQWNIVPRTAVEPPVSCRADERIHIDLVVGRRVLDGDFFDIDFELFGDQHRQATYTCLVPISMTGITNVTLPARSMRRKAFGANGASAVSVSRTLGACRQPEAEQQAAANGNGRAVAEKVAARSRNGVVGFNRQGVHLMPPSG